MDKDNKHADDKQPIDELFARKLKNASLPLDTDGFDRLQSRLGQRKTEPRLTLWRNPNVQRYVAAAACLLLVCLFGWLYLSDGQKVVVNGPPVAIRKPVAPVHTDSKTGESRLSAHVAPEQKSRNNSGSAGRLTLDPQRSAQLAITDKETKRSADKGGQVNTKSAELMNRATQTPAEKAGEAMIARAKPVDLKTDNAIAPKAITDEIPASAERVVVAQPTATPAAERVLVVTIAEPERLVAARQAAKTVTDEPTVAAGEKTQKETKTTNFWEQVRRVKQGEVFARREVGGEERGLISRAYNGLKHSIDKDKGIKQ